MYLLYYTVGNGFGLQFQFRLLTECFYLLMAIKELQLQIQQAHNLDSMPPFRWCQIGLVRMISLISKVKTKEFMQMDLITLMNLQTLALNDVPKQISY